MAGQVVHLKSIGNVAFNPNRRSKSIRLSVKPDKTVMVSYPYHVSEKEVLAFISKHADWIKESREKMQQKARKICFGDEIKTNLHTIIIKKGNEKGAKSNGSTVSIFIDDIEHESATMFIEKVLEEVYRFEAKKLLPQRLLQLANLHQFKVNKISIRNNKRNWGSCSSQNNISLNLQMMKLPDELIDYILLHELVHTEEKNHGPKFWKRLDEITQNRAKELAKEVKKYSTYTLS